MKETFKALASDVRAASAVRTFAFVATIIPIYPAVAEKTAPIKKATAIKGEECIGLSGVPSWVPNHANKIAVGIAKYVKIFHSAFKKAIAPSAI